MLLGVAVLLLAMVTLSVVVLLVDVVRRHRKQAAHRRGRCPACGYDLRVQLALSGRGEPSDGPAAPARCPECGAAGTMPAS